MLSGIMHPTSGAARVLGHVPCHRRKDFRMRISIVMVNNVPMIVYGKVGRAIGVFVIPMFVITSFPALFVLGRMTLPYMIWGLAAPFLFLGIARVCWRSGIRHYTSAGG
jgi:ABC-type uncharacterized transport system permease subunit